MTCSEFAIEKPTGNLKKKYLNKNKEKTNKTKKKHKQNQTPPQSVKDLLPSDRGEQYVTALKLLRSSAVSLLWERRRWLVQLLPKLCFLLLLPNLLNLEQIINLKWAIWLIPEC